MFTRIVVAELKKRQCERTNAIVQRTSKNRGSEERTTGELRFPTAKPGIGAERHEQEKVTPPAASKNFLATVRKHASASAEAKQGE